MAGNDTEVRIHMCVFLIYLRFCSFFIDGKLALSYRPLFSDLSIQLVQSAEMNYSSKSIVCCAVLERKINLSTNG